MPEKLLVLDSNSILYRAYFALPKLTTNSGEVVNGVYGFLLVLFKLIKEIQPQYLAACFDSPTKTFRHQKFKEYKAKRPKAPDELISQLPKLKEVLEAFSISYFEVPRYEADDIIGTIIKKTPENMEKIIVSGDLDSLQLLKENVKLYFLQKGVKKNEILDKEKVKEKYGIFPEQIPDFKALVGDPSDNIPGAKGIGKKTALFLLQKYKNLNGIFENIEEDDLKEKILKEKEKILLNLKLVKIEENVPILFQLDKLKFGNYNQKKVEEVLKKYEFLSLIKKLNELKKGKNLTLF